MQVLCETPWKSLLPADGDDRAVLHLKLQRLQELRQARDLMNYVKGIFLHAEYLTETAGDASLNA